MANTQGKKRRRRTLPRYCSVCGERYDARLDSLRAGKGRFCSPKCAGQDQSEVRDQNGENNSNWKGGVSKDAYRYKKRQVERYPKRVEARRVIARELRAGRMERGPCEVCGETKAQAHHDDYDRPLAVRWLCVEHHAEVHGHATGRV